MGPGSRSESEPGPAGGCRRGFTFVEMLVVIGIVAMLAALLLPALARAKTVTHRTGCLANLKHWSLAMQMYTEDQDDFIPRESAFSPGTARNLWADIRHGRTSDVWYNALPDYAGVPRAASYFSRKADFYQRTSFFHCPSARMTPGTLYADFSMSLNSKLIKLGLAVNRDDLCRAPNTVMFLDNLLEGERAPVPGPPPSNLGQPSSYANRFSIRHGGRGNMVFWDGHAESFAGGEVVDRIPGPNYGLAIQPQTRIVWDLCPP